MSGTRRRKPGREPGRSGTGVRSGRGILAGLALLAPLVVTACSVPDQQAPVAISGADLPSPPSTVVGSPAGPGIRIAVFFVNSDNVLVAVPRSDPTGDLGVAIGDLLAGPTRHEVSAGVSSALPGGTRILNSAVTGGGTAELNFGSALTSVTGHEELLAFAQIVATATSAPGVLRVQISVEGQPVNAPLPGGTLAQHPVTRADYATILAG